MCGTIIALIIFIILLVAFIPEAIVMLLALLSLAVVISISLWFKRKKEEKEIKKDSAIGQINVWQNQNKSNIEDRINRLNSRWQNEYYQSELKPIADKYFAQMQAIEKAWSYLCNQKEFFGEHAKKFRSACEENIQLYKQMAEIELKFGEIPPPSAPAFKRLAMLYEKQGNFESAADVCREAISCGCGGDDMKKRLARMEKKQKKNSTDEEQISYQKNKSETIIAKNSNDKQNLNSTNTPISSIIVDTPVIVDENNIVMRTAINSDVIDEAQQRKASEVYTDYICSKYYKDYPEKPFISQDRELYTNWEAEADSTPFSNQRILPKSAMTRFDDGLLPGHVYMLYWLHFINRKRVPALFEYQFGIWFTKEKSFLEEQGYINGSSVTIKGLKTIISHEDVILESSNSATAKIRIEKLKMALSAKPLNPEIETK